MKKWIVGTLSVALVAGVILYLKNVYLVGDPQEMEIMELKVMNHLLEQGYKKAEIKEVKAEFNLKRKGTNGEYDAYVIFNDEPNIKYRFFITKYGYLEKGTPQPNLEDYKYKH